MRIPVLGAVEWFQPRRAGELERAACIRDALADASITQLRFDISWAELAYEEWKGISPSFYDRLIPMLAERLELLPNLMYTPPSLGITDASASPPRDLGMFGYIAGRVCERWGAHFEYLELWNEPNGHSYWNFRLDPRWDAFREMIALALPVVHEHGKKAVLGGPSPFDLWWFRNMQQDNLLVDCDVIGIHGFPGTFDDSRFPWQGWQANVSALQELLDQVGSPAEIWITEMGATDEYGLEFQVRTLNDALSVPVPRAYWYSVMDFRGETVQQVAGDPTIYPGDFHMGLLTWEGEPKELYRHVMQMQRKNAQHESAYADGLAPAL